MAFHKFETEFEDLYIIKPDVFGDERGFFQELYNSDAFAAIGLGHLSFVQDNLSYSGMGTLRGLHFQAPPHAQGKLVTTLRGRVLDVALDIREGSKTFGKVFAYVIDDQSREMLYIPPGFAHGFQVLSEDCLFLYKCTSSYHRESEGGVLWNDPQIAVPWEDIEPILSPKDKLHPTWESFETPFKQVQNQVESH